MTPKVVRAAVLSGGGIKGAFQVGALVELLEHQGRAPFDGVFGVSTGALAAAVLASAPPLGQRGQALKLRAIYEGLQRPSDLYRGSHFPLCQAFNLLARGTLYRPRGLRRLIAESVDCRLVNTGLVQFGCGVTEIESGAYVSIQSGAVSHAWILASASMPSYFPAVAIDGRYYVDGGLRHITPLRDACHWLARQPADRRELWLFLCAPTIVPAYAHGVGGLEMAGRALSLLETDVYLNDLEQVRIKSGPGHLGRGYAAIDTQLIAPTEDYGDALDVNPATIATMLQAGQAAAAGIA